MEKSRRIQIYCLFLASLFLGLFGAVCLYLGIAGEYNDAMGYFNVGSIFAPVVYCTIVCGAVLGIVGWIVFRKHVAPDKALPQSAATRTASALAALCIFIVAGVGAYQALGNHEIPFRGVEVFSFVTAVFAAASLIADAFFAKGKKNDAWRSLLSFGTTLYCASRVLILYFDQTVAVNSPVKFICQLSYLSFMLVCTARTGLTLGRGHILPRYIFALCCAMTAGGACAVAALICTLAGTQCAAIVGIGCVDKIGLLLYCATNFLVATRIKPHVVERVSKRGSEIPDEELVPAQIDDEEFAESAENTDIEE